MTFAAGLRALAKFADLVMLWAKQFVGQWGVAGQYADQFAAGLINVRILLLGNVISPGRAIKLLLAIVEQKQKLVTVIVI